MSVLAIAFAAGCGGDDDGADAAAGDDSGNDQVKLHAIQMLTGSSGFYGQALVKGNELAVEELNAAGGLLGNEIQFDSDDNASEVDQTVTLARRVAEDDSVSALIAPTYQPTMEAACPITTQLGLPQIAGQSASPPEDVNPEGNCFTNSAAIDSQVTDTIAVVAEEYDVTRFGQVYDQQNAYQAQFNEVGAEFIEESGWDLVVDSGVDEGTSNYGPIITELLEADAEVVIPNLTTEDAARFMQQARSRGVDALFVSPNASLVNERLYELSGGAADGLFVSTNQSEAEPAYGEFVEAFEERFGELEDPISGFGYDSVMILAEAIEAAESADRDAIREALTSLDEVCASICYVNDGEGNFVTTDLYYLELTADGFVPVDVG